MGSGRGGDSAKAAYWQGVMAEQHSSGLSIRSFCRQREVAEARFYWWKRRLNRSGTAAEAEVASGAPRGFIRVGGTGEAEAPSGVRVVLGGKVEVSVARGFDRAVLGAVVEVLRGVCG